jgi:hypothetical protein
MRAQNSRACGMKKAMFGLKDHRARMNLTITLLCG